jgi:hypothetical protein
MRTSKTAFRILGAAVVAAFAVAGAFGGGIAPAQQAKLTASDATTSDDLGVSAALDGETAVLGAYARNSARGAACVFTRSGTVWSQEATLTADDGVPDDLFGVSVGVSGDTAVVGAFTKDSYRGAAYVFRRSGTDWTQEARLAPEDAADSDEFGYSVAVAGGTAVAGAYNKDSGRGAAYVFTRSGTSWTQQAKLTADDSEINDNFGHSVAIAGDTVVVGAPRNYRARGAAYVFTRAGANWTQTAKLTAADTLDNDNLGFVVACNGDTAVAGAPYQNRSHGAAYVYVRSGANWTQQAKLMSADAADNDIFGISVALSGDAAVVGAYLKNSARGAAYVFRRAGTTWTEDAKLTPSDSAPNDYFGYSVAAASDTVLVGAFAKDAQRGAGYVFTLPPPAGFVLPTSVAAKTNVKHPEKSTLTASGTFDTGGGVPDFSGAATFDVGGFHLDVPAFLAKGRSLTYSAGGITLTITAARSGSSRAVFNVKAVGDLAGKVDRDGPLAFHFKNAVHDLKGAVTLTKGALGPHCVTAPDLCVRAAAATIKGGGNDSLQMTLGFVTDGIAPAFGERDMTIGFGGTYTSPLLPGAAFVRKRSTYVFTAKAPGITKATVDYAKGTITIVGSRLDLGAFDAGGSSVALKITRGSETRSVAVRMSRAGAKLTY